jgi:N-acetylglucosamine malate deacetylase 2
MTFASAAASPSLLRFPACAGGHRAGASSPEDGRLAGPAPPVAAGGPLPPAQNVLAVIARPGQESAVLGGLLYAFRGAGARLALLSLTRGEASPLNSTCWPLEAIRPWELQLAASVLGIASVTVASYPDGGLCRSPVAELAEQVRRVIREQEAELLLVIDPAADAPDDAMVASAARTAAEQAGVPAVACTAPDVPSTWVIDLGAKAAAARAIQRSAAAAHTSQSQALSQVKRRLDMLGDQESLRWLAPAHQAAEPKKTPAAVSLG